MVVSYNYLLAILNSDLWDYPPMMPRGLVAIVGADSGGSGHGDKYLAGIEKHYPESAYFHKVNEVSQIARDKIFCDIWDVSVLDLPFCHSLTLCKSFIYTTRLSTLMCGVKGLSKSNKDLKLQ